VLRALLNAIPGVGGSLNELLAGKGQRIIEERRDSLLRHLAKHLEAIEDEAIRKDYFETPEGFDLLIKALDESRKTRSEEKRDLIARVLRGALTDDEGEYSPEEYLYLISDLTVQELRVARSIYENRPEVGGVYANWHRRILEELNIDDADLRMMLDRLESRGLCQALLTEDPHTSRVYRSPGFVKLMRFLELDE
jgi:hypothetical protein